MRINNLGYLLKEGVKGIFLHGFMSFAAVCVTVACLLIMGSFSVLMYNVNIMVEELNKTNEVMAYVDSELPDAEAKSIGTKINRIENVHKAEFVDREVALERFIEDHSDERDSFAGLIPEDLRHRFVVTLEDNELLNETVALIEAIPGVAHVRADFALAEGFITLQKVLHIASAVVIFVLLVVSLLIISNTVKLAMYDRRDEIAIMKMVGATNGFIRFPFVVQGFFLGIIGAALAFGAEWFLYDGLVKKIAEVDALGLFNFVPFNELLLPMVIVFGAAGLFVGIFGSISAIRKFMDV